MPAHTASWRHGAPDAVANCDWLVPLDPSQVDNPFKKLDLVSLDPSRVETRALVREVLSEVPSPSNKYRGRVCKSIEMTGVYPTILKCPELLGPDSY